MQISIKIFMKISHSFHFSCNFKKDCMPNFYVATLNFKRFNGRKEVNTVFVLNFHYFHWLKNLKEIIKNFF